MTFIQMQERLRVELLRRINRGTLSISLLARQTGFGKSHLSNFLHARRQLSLQGIDRMLTAQYMGAEDLLYLGKNNLEHLVRNNPKRTIDEEIVAVPLVSQAAALFEPHVPHAAVQAMLPIPPGILSALKPRAASSRRAWQRFVAVRMAQADAVAMDPLLLPGALAVIDRHYNVLSSYRPGRQNLFAVRDGMHLMLRFVEYSSRRLVLRPLNLGYPVALIETGPENLPRDLIVGRVVLTINEL